MFVAPAGDLRIAEAENILALDEQFAVGRAVDGRDHVQESGLARSGRSHERQEFSFGNVDGNIVESSNLESIALENLAHAADLHYFGGRGNVGCDYCAHACPLILILSPSLRVGGAVVITFSPPTNPSTNAPSLR